MDESFRQFPREFGENLSGYLGKLTGRLDAHDLYADLSELQPTLDRGDLTQCLDMYQAHVEVRLLLRIVPEPYRTALAALADEADLEAKIESMEGHILDALEYYFDSHE